MLVLEVADMIRSRLGSLQLPRWRAASVRAARP